MADGKLREVLWFADQAVVDCDGCPDAVGGARESCTDTRTLRGRGGCCITLRVPNLGAKSFACLGEPEVRFFSQMTLVLCIFCTLAQLYPLRFLFSIPSHNLGTVPYYFSVIAIPQHFLFLIVSHRRTGNGFGRGFFSQEGL